MSTSARAWTTPAGPPQRSSFSDSGGGMHSASGGTMGLMAGGAAPGGASLDDMQRAYRIMELTRKQSVEESANTLRMQRQQIDKLKKDNDRMKEDLALETRQARQANNMSASAQIAKLQDQGDIYTRKIETEKRRLEELDKQILKLQNSILLQRKEMGGVNATRDSNNGVQKQIRILENRLDKALVKFNEALAHNSSLRGNIDNLRRERVVFDGIYNKLQRELEAKQDNMSDIMAEANRASDARRAAQEEMVALKAQADREQLHFEEEWKQLGALIDKDRRAKDASLKSKDGRVGTRGIDPAIEEEQSLRKRVTKGAWGIATDKANIHLSMEKVQSYEEAFAKIQKATRITDIDQLVHTFVHAEDHNFSLFNYVNDLANESEKVAEQIEAVKSEVTRFRGQGEANDAERKKMLADMEAKLAKNHEKARQAEEKFASSSKTLNALKSGVGNIFSRLGCANLKASELLGNAGVTESNCMQYLAIIEQRTNDLLALYNQHRAEAGDAPAANAFARTTQRSLSPQSSASGHSPYHRAAAAPAEPLSIHAPSASSAFDDEDGDDDGDDEDVQPLSREELHRQQAERQQQQQQQSDDY